MPLLLSDRPQKVKNTSLLVEYFEPSFVVRLLKCGLLKVKDLVKAYQEDVCQVLGLTDKERLELESWFNEYRLLKPKKDLIREHLPAPNPNIVPFERIVLPLGLDGREGSNRGDNHSRSLEATDDLSAIRSWISMPRMRMTTAVAT